MPTINRNRSLSIWLSNYSNLKPLQSVINICLILLGPILAVATYLFLGPFNVAGQSVWLRFFLLLDLIYVLLIVGIVVVRILYVLSQRRSRLAGSKLHFRLAGVFTTMSLLPTITVAVFATVSINLGLETWFSERVQSVVGTSLSAARSYANEQQAALEDDIQSIADDLQKLRKNRPFIEDDELRNELALLQLELQRGLKEAFILNDVEAKYEVYALSALVFGSTTGVFSVNPSSLLKVCIMIEERSEELLTALINDDQSKIH